ncbi:MAG: flagellar basal body rod protein FlgC [Alphaproteobacteria bacterium]|jgi:flagellar basal-body rod protein FlgC|nr:flagellar basal body rod protein FlgC [Alphaproteobacteria bacterium]MBL8652794.1 flagellar basal body rod protein FlgC [Alphaproteobacteria bacterium]MBN9495295.1 flagellar basal body rod protein FlgC [Alphaproteobacteria bacterium]MCA0451628.1 flagellar basal body rod protein FlgC [Pseudomonadota bacterium]
MDLQKAIKVSASGLQAQSTRMRVISENIANADALGETPGADPFRRKTISFRNVLDRQLGAETVRPSRIGTDKTAFQRRYDPGHPAADQEGYVLAPNVNTLIEAMDMRQAQRSYEANINVIDASKTMIMRTIDLLRG